MPVKWTETNGSLEGMKNVFKNVSATCINWEMAVINKLDVFDHVVFQ